MEKRNLIIGIAILVLIIALVVYFVVTGNKSKEGNNTGQNATTIQEVHQFKTPTAATPAIAESGVSAIAGANYKKLDAGGLSSEYGITAAPEDFCVIESTGTNFFEIAVIKGDTAQIKSQYFTRIDNLKAQYANDSSTLDIINSPIVKSFNEYAIMIIGKDKVQIEAKIDNYFN